MAKYTYNTEVFVDVEITVDEVVEFIEDYADRNDLEMIKTAIKNAGWSLPNSHTFKSADGTYIKDEKLQLLSKAFSRYTLEELEQRLGNKFNLI
jgi:hypothetical protein